MKERRKVEERRKKKKKKILSKTSFPSIGLHSIGPQLTRTTSLSPWQSKSQSKEILIRKGVSSENWLKWSYEQKADLEAEDGIVCSSMLDARSNTGWFGTAPDKSFTEASWWELTVLPMLAYMTWAIFYYFKVCPELALRKDWHFQQPQCVLLSICRTCQASWCYSWFWNLIRHLFLEGQHASQFPTGKTWFQENLLLGTAGRKLSWGGIFADCLIGHKSSRHV